MNEECLLYYMLYSEMEKKNRDLQREVQSLTAELMETNTGVLALMQEFDRNSSALLLSDREKTEFLENLKKTNKEHIERIKAQEEALVQADKMASLGHLVAGVAHEINNPTTYIRANIELLQKYWTKITESTPFIDNQKLRTYMTDFEEIMESMYKGTDRIIDIVNGLKFFARQEKAVYEVFDLNKCITEAFKLVKNEFVRNKIQYSNHSEDGRLHVLGSPQQIEQTVINLFINAITAIKAGPSPDGGIIDVTLKKVDNQYVALAVRDNGCGIAEKNFKKIFNPFFTTNQATGGTGLGLSIVYGIIKEHGGKIEVKSEEGRGTEFTIFLHEYHKV